MAEGFREFTAFVNGFADGPRLAAAITDGLQSAKIAAIAGARQCFVDQCSPDGTPWPPLTFSRPGGSGGDVPLRDTDRLMMSIDATATGDEITLSTNRQGAAVQNFGAVIVPVNVQFLTIPMTLEAKRADGARLFKGSLHPKIAQNKQSGVLVDDEDVVQYLLLKKVTIPRREFMGFSEDTQMTVLNIVMDRIFNFANEGAGV